MSLSKFAKLYRVDDPDSFRIKDWDPVDTNDLDIEKDEAKDLLEEGVKRLSELQERLYAQDRWSVLLIFQAMDAAGKDSVIKHVMSGVNPQGCEVHSFKQPSQEELDHDFIWRTTAVFPSAAGSESSIAPTMRKCWSCACIRAFSKKRRCPPSS